VFSTKGVWVDCSTLECGDPRLLHGFLSSGLGWEISFGSDLSEFGLLFGECVYKQLVSLGGFINLAFSN
jgi:hypothetical protein